MASTLHNPALIAARSTPRATTIAWWIVTALFCLEMSFTAYYELMRLPEAAQAFTNLGFPAPWFRIEFSWAKVVGVIVLLVPMIPARLKEWAYAGFAINHSALIAHLSLGQGPRFWSPSAITSVFWVLSYIFWRRLQSTQASASQR